MGVFFSRNVAVEEQEQASNNAYKYPPRSGNNFFGTHFIMGGERFDTPQPEAYLFGENADLNFLGKRPTSFPYPPPQANEPTKTLKSLVNIRKESVRFVRVAATAAAAETNSNSDAVDVAASAPAAPVAPAAPTAAATNGAADGIDGNTLSGCATPPAVAPAPPPPPPASYNIEFTFDSDVKCAITIFYFCTEELSPSAAKLLPRDGLTSETYHYERGINQFFSQPGHVFQPALMPEDDLTYNSTREQYPVAIHCVVEEGNEECRQSHTTVCVVDHHPESNSYVLRALKQKIFVDGLCYLLQEIYGIENKAVNKSSIDEEIDDHGSECVICMSDTRDTLILPCRHLCLCNSCADSLRYQANNCPICRAPFRALLQIRAVQKGVSSHVTLHQNTPTSVAGGDPTPCEQHVPPGYMPVSLIEALNGPPQFIVRTRPNEADVIDGPSAPPASADNHKATSPLKPNSQRRPKIKKTVSTATNTSEVETSANTTTTDNAKDKAAIVEIAINEANEKKSASVEKLNMRGGSAASQDKLQIVNERHSLKLPKKKTGKQRNVTTNKSSSASSSSHNDEDIDDDSENEKLSPLLTPGSRRPSKPTTAPAQLAKALTIEGMMNAPLESRGGGDAAGAGDDDVEMQNLASLKKHKRPDFRSADASGGTAESAAAAGSAANNAEDSDYYTPEDTQNSILSPLCPADRTASAKSGAGSGGSGGGDKLGSLKSNAGSFKGASSLAKKQLHKKSTSVGNIGAGGGGGAGGDHLKGNNVSSLPDMLDSPISGNSASTRSSSDSYSSSSSTKQLLSSNPTTAAANIMVDDKTALQNAVNV